MTKRDKGEKANGTFRETRYYDGLNAPNGSERITVRMTAEEFDRYKDRQLERDGKKMDRKATIITNAASALALSSISIASQVIQAAIEIGGRVRKVKFDYYVDLAANDRDLAQKVLDGEHELRMRIIDTSASRFEVMTGMKVLERIVVAAENVAGKIADRLDFTAVLMHVVDAEKEIDLKRLDVEATSTFALVKAASEEGLERATAAERMAQSAKDTAAHLEALVESLSDRVNKGVGRNSPHQSS